MTNRQHLPRRLTAAANPGDSARVAPQAGSGPPITGSRLEHVVVADRGRMPDVILFASLGLFDLAACVLLLLGRKEYREWRAEVP